MNLDEIFRSLFGFRSRLDDNHFRPPRGEPYDEDHHDELPQDFFQPRPPPFFFWAGPRYGEAEMKDEGEEGYTGDFSIFGGLDTPMDDEQADHFPSSFLRGPAELFRHFDDMLRNIDQVFRGFGLAEHPGHVPALPGLERDPNDPGALRDRMLKDPDSERAPHVLTPRESQPSGIEPFGIEPMPSRLPATDQRIDTDLDEEVLKGNLGSILAQRDQDRERPKSGMQFGGGFRSVSVTTIRGADGKVEERRTISDGAGNEQTTVRRSLGDQSHIVTKRRDRTGSEEVTEDFSNLSNGEKGDFSNRWHRSQPGDLSSLGRGLPGADGHPGAGPGDGASSILNNLFGLSFNGFGKR